MPKAIVMQINKINILCTRPLDDRLINEAARAGIEIEAVSFIETEPIKDAALRQQIEDIFQQSAVVVFTSMNAVEAVAGELAGRRPDWSIYCIGTATAELVKNNFGEAAIAGVANNASALAQLIVKKSYADEVVFFCGDRRRDELPDILRKNDIEVTEIVVYLTLTVPHTITKSYHGIIFFSPSAVESFFLNNTIEKEMILFAIGDTTVAAIQQFSKNPIVIAAAPGKENLVKQMIAYFA